MSTGATSAGRLEVAAWGLVACGMVLVAILDLATPLPLGDEFMYRLSVQNFASGHFVLSPWLLPLALVQVSTAAAVAHLGAPVAWTRLTVLPFQLLAALAVAATARRLGATRFWAAVAGAALVLSPVSLIVATGIMSDPAYLALLAVAVWLSVRWLETGRGLGWVMAAVTLAALQRQLAVGVLVALLATMAVGRHWRRREAALLLGGLVALTAALVWVPPIVGLTGGALTNTASERIFGFSVVPLVVIVVVSGTMVGFIGLPLCGGLIAAAPRPVVRSRRLIVPVALAAVCLAGAAALAFALRGTVFPGDQLGVWGLGPIETMNIHGKVSPIPTPVLVAMEGLAVLAMLTVLAVRADAWFTLGTETSTFLVATAVFHLVPLYFVGVGDRYFLAVAVPLLPLLAAACPRVPRPGWGQRAARAWAIAALTGGLLVYALGGMDFVAWRGAQHEAEAIAMRSLTWSQLANTGVDYGMEYAAPYYQQHHRLPPGTIAFNALRPRDPVAALIFSDPRDPRPGVIYGWLTRGKVVIVCLRSPSCLGPEYTSVEGRVPGGGAPR